MNSDNCLVLFPMRNATKLKLLLQLYMLTFDLDEEEQFYLVMLDKRNHSSHTIVAKSYSLALSKAYSFMIKAIKAEEE